MWQRLPLQVSRRAALQTNQPLVDDGDLAVEKLGFIGIAHALQLLRDTLPQTQVLLTHGVDVEKDRLQTQTQKRETEIILQEPPNRPAE